MKVIEVRKEDLLTELSNKSRIIRLTVTPDKSVTKEVNNIPVGEIVDSMTRPQQGSEFFFKVIREDSDNE